MGKVSAIQTIKTQEAKVGMFIILPRGFKAWLYHPFFRTRFLLKTETQLKTLQQSGISEIQIDTSKSNPIQDLVYETHPATIEPPPPGWNPKKNMSQTLRETIQNQTLSPKEKAQKVYESSLGLMYSLFESPTADAIIESKKAIASVVDLVLSDDETSLNLLKLIHHDFYTYTHSVNVGVLSISLAKRIYQGATDHNMHELGAGFFLHDLGKVSIDPAILNKPGPLDDQEKRIIRSHPGQSFIILKKANQLSRECGIIALQHHEREDGTGYPKGLKGDQIHDYARICCIADVFDALTSERSYKKPCSTFDALRIMKTEMINHFHRELFENFVFMFQKG